MTEKSMTEKSMTEKTRRRPRLSVVQDSSGAPRVMVVGAGWRFTSGISYYTCRLTNAIAEVAPTSTLLMRQLVPTALYPGRKRVGEQVNDLEYGPSVHVFDGLDWFWGPSMRKARRYMDEQRPQVMILQWWTGAVLHSYLRLARLAKRSGCKVIIEWHEVQDTGEARIPGVTRYVTKAMKALLNMVDGHVVHSEYDLNLLRRTYFLPDELVTIAAHGPYDHHRQADAAPASATIGSVLSAVQPPVEIEDPKDFVLLYFGVVRPYKGVEDLVAAFDLLPAEVRDRTRLMLVGETWEGWTAPREAVAASPNRDRIEVVDRYVTDSEVSAYFATADAVVLPYRRSSSSGPLHIAMSSGLPVVVSRVGGLVEAAGGYEGTFFVDPEDPAGLAAVLAELPATRGHRYTDPHSWDNTVVAYGELLRRIGAATWAPAVEVGSSHPVHNHSTARHYAS
ncbi:glycosyltransferase involved in cell wall biosynthesis [Nakamurella sp. UYEF19]|uniref:glycosyltransferase family 4 protein n=1 Tax=Nakamurella sp. UYEF19 TaxID=1756392 RepID=UPI003392CFE2